MCRPMHRFALTLIAFLTFCIAAPGFAAPNLKDHLSAKRPLPPKGKRVAYTPEKKLGRAELVPKDILQNPKTLIRFLRSNPDQVNVDRMTPPLTLTFAKILMGEKALFLAEKLLYGGVKKWPDRIDLAEQYGRVLIQIGQPDAAIKLLEKAVKAKPDSPSTNFLYAFAIVRRQPSTPKTKQLAMKHFRNVLRLNPKYTDESGWTAQNIRNQLDRMMGLSPRGKGRPGAP